MLEMIWTPLWKEQNISMYQGVRISVGKTTIGKQITSCVCKMPLCQKA